MRFIKEMIARKQNSPVLEEVADTVDAPPEYSRDETTDDDIIAKLSSIRPRGRDSDEGPDQGDDAQVPDFSDLVKKRVDPKLNGQLAQQDDNIPDMADIEDELAEIDDLLGMEFDRAELESDSPDAEPVEVEERAGMAANLHSIPSSSEKTFPRPVSKNPSLESAASAPSAFRSAPQPSAKIQSEKIQSDQSASDTNDRPVSQPKQIWDLQTDDVQATKPVAAPAEVKTTPEPKIVEVPAPAAGRSGRRAGRAKTRLLGFEHAHDMGSDPFEASSGTAKSAETSFPVGWIVVVTGPGRGASFSLTNGVSQIGRGEDQAIKLDFGDTSISRSSHAAIAYDNEQRTFFLGHGGKANLVRLNDKPVLSTEVLSDGDLVRIGETTLRLVALCGADFHWETDGQDDSDDAAIA